MSIIVIIYMKYCIKKLFGRITTSPLMAIGIVLAACSSGRDLKSGMQSTAQAPLWWEVAKSCCCCCTSGGQALEPPVNRLPTTTNTRSQNSFQSGTQRSYTGRSASGEGLQLVPRSVEVHGLFYRDQFISPVFLPTYGQKLTLHEQRTASGSNNPNHIVPQGVPNVLDNMSATSTGFRQESEMTNEPEFVLSQHTMNRQENNAKQRTFAPYNTSVPVMGIGESTVIGRNSLLVPTTYPQQRKPPRIAAYNNQASAATTTYTTSTNAMLASSSSLQVERNSSNLTHSKSKRTQSPKLTNNNTVQIKGDFNIMDTYYDGQHGSTTALTTVGQENESSQESTSSPKSQNVPELLGRPGTKPGNGVKDIKSAHL